MEALIGFLGAFFNMVIPTVIFLFLNDAIFLSKIDCGFKKETKQLRSENRGKLVMVSPIGLFMYLFIAFLLLQIIVGQIFPKYNECGGMSSAIIKLSFAGGLGMDSGSKSAANEMILLNFVLLIVTAVPICLVVIRQYCRIVGCSKSMGVFVYMATIFMYVTSTLITMPISEISSTVSSIISTVSFIVMLLIFYVPARDKIEFMRQNENTGLLDQINILPSINFVLLIILLGFEIMLDANGYLDMTYYLIILAFSLILYAAAQLSYNILFRHIEERLEIEKLSGESLASQEEITLAFAEITEAKSGQTGKHVKRVSEYSRVIAEAMGLPKRDVENIRIASMMHDVGKLLIPPEILEKNGKLTDEEFDIIKTHVKIGEDLLHNAPGEIMAVARVIAQQHHEWWNGGGYLGMVGEEIALSARITAIADVYDALTSNRSYKKAWYSEQAYEMIVNERGLHFDPKVVDAFVEHFDEIKEIQEQYRDDHKSAALK